MKIWYTLILGFLCFSAPGLACGTCFGNPEDPQTKGIQAAILVMLAVTYFTITGLILFFIWFLKRKRQQPNPTPV